MPRASKPDSPDETSTSSARVGKLITSDAESGADESTSEFDAKRFLAEQTGSPGVYQMFDQSGEILYVGKAKNLKKRLSSYFQKSRLGSKTLSLVARIAHIEVTVTHTETEALLLEHNLIKQQRPPYNILLRDDKSYPYIYISTEDDYPRLAYHRGSKRRKGKYYGPFPSAGSVKESLNLLQKIFRVRQCEDSFFRNRSRPCLQYQIDRCTAPCVGAVTKEQYDEDVRHTQMFLEGKEERITDELVKQMDAASANLEFEQAAACRDQITHLRRVQEQQVIEEGAGNVDVFAAAYDQGMACVQMLCVRQGRVLGSRSYYPRIKLEDDIRQILAAFLPQYYLAHDGREFPREIITAIDLGEDRKLIADALSEAAGHKLQITHQVRGGRQKWIQLADTTAQQNLTGRLANEQHIARRFEQLQETLQLEAVPERIECFDISHSSGEATVASCVVFETAGAVKSDYRRFNIESANSGDDYAAMREALTRRYTRLQEEAGKLPDILLIDGGKGQLSQAEQVMDELQVFGVTLLGVAKGTTRKAGFETLYLSEERDSSENDSSEKNRAKNKAKEFVLSSSNSALHLIQQIRDEAHRFAITGHKQRRDKKRRTSTLEGIPGVGAKRRRELLRFFGGQQAITRAGVDELARVPGISRTLAQTIYDTFHDS